MGEARDLDRVQAAANRIIRTRRTCLCGLFRKAANQIFQLQVTVDRLVAKPQLLPDLTFLNLSGNNIGNEG